VEDNGVGREVTYKLKSDANRKSFGSQLAQKLVLTAHKVKRQARFEVMDLFDNNSLPSGTAVTFTLPLIVMD